MKRRLSLIVTALALAALACNSLINLPLGGTKTIPTETFSIDEPAPAGPTVTDATLVMAASNATLVLAGGSSNLVEGEIQFNIADWKPTLTTSASALHIEQNAQDSKIISAGEGTLNQWNLKLGNGLTNVRIDCPAGNFVLDFAETLQDGANITINMGAGNLRLIIPAAVAASVEVQRGPSNVTTEGAWTSNGNAHTTNGSGPTWIITVEMGVGNLTLTSQ